MAEILGLVASIAAVAGVADHALRLARSMKRLSRDLGAARKDIRCFARDIDAFSSIIGAAHYTLQTHAKPESPSKIVVFIHERKLLGQLVEQSDRVIDHIEELRPGIKSLKSSISFITRIRWIMRREDVNALRPKMESVKTSLNLVISMVMYEALMQSIGLQASSRNNSEATQREMRRLKRDMKRFMEQIFESQERQQQRPIHNWESPENTFVDVQMDIQEALVELGHSIVKTDTIPDMENSSTSSRTLRPDLDRRAVPVVNEHRRGSPVSSRRHLRHRRSPIREHVIVNLHREPPRTPREVFIQQDNGQERPRSESEEAHILDEVRELPPSEAFIQQDDQEMSGSESEEAHVLEEVREIPTERSVSDPGEGPSTLNIEHGIEHGEESPASNQTHAEGDFISVHTTKRKICFNPATRHATISGYIPKASGGVVQIKAYLDPKLSENIISLALVIKLGLPIDLYDSDYDKARDWKWIRIGDGHGYERKSRGTVTLEWSQGAFVNHVPLKVHCWVYEDDEEHVLVLGKPFLDKRKHYWEDNVTEEG